ncbi:hypothetical protein M409DRAFT_50439 [Zasmidium cellare ATCC 36951]|uniref:Uncharacterized protein n=1 Tax=Zasmidium cellare ATCC 36951 TaxID=1080233 RepID=A0A6A6D060_ZASCE|nr:uncharacterized protein M409DRAFT_50439 [Zasmidium cellare ATCC 36951]KAF2171798.1 hypothetical protein M409DRAFT_50439 [Zasmidium cellare ATCC 36951]
MPSKELRFALCTCGKPVYENCVSCLPCLQAQQKLYHRYSLSPRPSKDCAPPPPTQGGNLQAPTMTLPIRTGRPSDASEAITRAFSSDSDGGHLFPSALYRHPIRSSSRTSSTTSSRRPSDSPSSPLSRPLVPSTDSTGPRTPRSSTPEIRLVDSSYAPMAAGFARLSMKDAAASTEPVRRPASARPSMELDARMFQGPA